FLFFQAEDGIRDFHVTGVQTCALPICSGRVITIRRTRALSVAAPVVSLMAQAPGIGACAPPARSASATRAPSASAAARSATPARSEERRVGQERRAPWWPYRTVPDRGG